MVMVMMIMKSGFLWGLPLTLANFWVVQAAIQSNIKATFIISI